jgi:hypothetical protein
MEVSDGIRIENVIPTGGAITTSEPDGFFDQQARLSQRTRALEHPGDAKFQKANSALAGWKNTTTTNNVAAKSTDMVKLCERRQTCRLRKARVFAGTNRQQTSRKQAGNKQETSSKQAANKQQTSSKQAARSTTAASHHF